MELFKLFGTIAIDNQDANAEIDKTTGIAEDAKSKISGAFEKVGNAAVKVGKAVATGMAAAGAAVVGLVKQSIDAYADYEQLVGGVETLFKDSAREVLLYADRAFETAGISANNYMETVTSFSASLLQSLGGDTAKAAEMADMAIIDMADNANKMGSSISAIQVAYQGFAKQNYSMLDNLKLGYGGTQAEMYRLMLDAAALNEEFAKTAEFTLTEKGQLIANFSDIVDAIHIVQTEMGITGTTAREASTTITGSLNMAKSAWQNLVGAMADDGIDLASYVDNFVWSVGVAVENLLPRIEIALEGVAGLVDQLAPLIIRKIPPLVSKLLPSVIRAASNILNALVASIPEFVSALSEILPETMAELIPALIDGAVVLCEGLISELPRLVDMVFSELPLMIGLALRDSESAFVSGIGEMFLTLHGAWNSKLRPAIEGIMEAFGSLWNAVQPILSVFGDLLTEMTGVSDGADLLRGVIILVSDALQFVADKVQLVANWISEHSAEIEATIRYLWQAVQDVWETVGKPIFDFIIDLVGSVAATFAEKMPEIKEFVSKCFSDIKVFWEENLKPCLDAIMTFVQETLLPIWQEVFEEGLTDSVDNAFATIKSAWEDVLLPVLTGITDFLTGTFTEDTSKALDGIANMSTGAVNFVILAVEAMINSAIMAINGLIATYNAVAGKLGLGEIDAIDLVSLDKVTVDWDAVNQAATSGEKIGLLDMFKRKQETHTVSDETKAKLREFTSLLRGIGDGATGSGSTTGTAAGMNVPTMASMMATGGVLKRGQIGLLEGSGAEAVVPLERNKGWISRVAQDMNASLGGSETNDLLARLLAAIENMDDSMTDKFTNAMENMRLSVNGREFGRMVREYA